MARRNGGSTTATDRETGIVAAYLAGAKWSEIEQTFGVGRSTISHVLRRSGVLPSRQQRKLDQESAEAGLTKLYELIQFQDQRIIELEAVQARYEAKLRRAGIPLEGSRSTTRRPSKGKPA